MDYEVYVRPEALSPGDLARSRYHKLGGWFLAFTVLICIWTANLLLGSFRMALGLAEMEGPVPGAVWLLVIPGLVETAALLAALILLFMRNIAFRIPVTFFCVCMGVFAIIPNPDMPAGDFRTAMMITGGVYAVAMGLTALYAWRSDRALVYCNRMPKHPIPMPAPPEAAPHWDERGLVYTDEHGNVTSFAPSQSIRTGRLPAGWHAKKRLRPRTKWTVEKGED